MLTQNRFRFHYEHVIRPDLLLKSHYENIMQVPRLSKVVVVAQVPQESVKQIMIVLEMLCGQRLVTVELCDSSTHTRGGAKAKRLLNRSTNVNYIVRCCLRNDKMYHFVEKLITVLCWKQYAVQFQDNTIQLQLNISLLRLFPEMQSNIELNLFPIQIIVSTSAKTEKETYLLWTGLFQNEV